MPSHSEIGRLDDWIAETPESIAARLEGAKASQAQIRLTIGVMALISMMMLIAAYNAYSSYDYGWTLVVTKRQAKEADERKMRLDAAAQKGPEARVAAEREEVDRQLAAQKTVASILTEQALKDWASSRIVQISLLGIRVSVDDAAVLGSVVLLVLSLWLLLVSRREYYTIGSLLDDTDTDKEDSSVTTSLERPSRVYSSGQRWLIFHTIISNNLFTNVDHSLATMDSLDGSDPSRPQDSEGGTSLSSDDGPQAASNAGTRKPTGKSKGSLNTAAFEFVRSFFFFFPVVALVIVFALDRLSYSCILPDPFLPDGGCEGYERRFYWASMVVSILCAFFLVICCEKSRWYSKLTEDRLHEYGRKLHADLSRSRAQS